MPRGSKPKQYDPALVQEVSRLYGEGFTQQEIATRAGLSQKVVWNIMRRHSIAARVAAKRNQWGANNTAWKGDDAGKDAFHRRLYSRFGKPAQCSQCGTTEAQHYDYANLTGRYEDLGDYTPMCRSCHWVYDSKVLNIAHMKERLHG
jgi:hypothetical protein